MVDLTKLAFEKEKAMIDKADLFDFYHKNWEDLIDEIRELRSDQLNRDIEPMRHFRDD